MAELPTVSTQRPSEYVLVDVKGGAWVASEGEWRAANAAQLSAALVAVNRQLQALTTWGDDRG